MKTAENKVAIYCRLSEEDRFKTNADDDSNSIVNQKALLTQYCKEKNWKIYKIYSDDDFTGADRNRPAFNELLKAAENGEFEIVLCKTQSRFTRELELVEKYINYLFPLWGVRFVSVVDNADTAVKGNKKSRQINGLINEWYLEDMSENIKAILTNRRKNGYFIGAFAPYGYKKDPSQRGHLIIDEEAAATVRLIYELYLSGIGRTAVARELNKRHIPTPTDYKLAHGERYKNNYTATHSHLWRYFMVANILTNETYIGNLVQNKAHSISYKTKIIKPTDKSEWIRVEGTHEPIISKEIWDKAQRILNSRAKPDFKSDFVNVFSGKVKCGLCGGGTRMAKSPQGERYFVCTTRYYAQEECKGTRLNYRVLCNEVLKEFNEIIKKYADENAISAEIKLENNLSGKIVQIENSKKQVKKKINGAAVCIKNLYVDKIKGIIDNETYQMLSEDFLKEKESLDSELKRLETAQKNIAENISQEKDKFEIIRSYMDIKEVTFDFVQTFIDEILVYEKERYSKVYDFEIIWNF